MQPSRGRSSGPPGRYDWNMAEADDFVIVMGAVCRDCGTEFPSDVPLGNAWWVDSPVGNRCPNCGGEGFVHPDLHSAMSALTRLDQNQRNSLAGTLKDVATAQSADEVAGAIRENVPGAPESLISAL